jgi:hypothetical protein
VAWVLSSVNPARFFHGGVAQEVGDLFGPIAEAKQIQPGPPSSVDGDRNFLTEAIANLLDNTTPVGKVRLQVEDRGEEPIVRIADSGSDIPPEERAAVMRRFYGIDKSRHVNGNGLGPSVVLAIVKLHDFDIAVGDAQPGCCFELFCYARPQSEPVPVRRSPLQRLLAPMTRLASHSGGESDSVDWIGPLATIDAPNC